MLTPGAEAPSFALPSTAGGEISDPWRDGQAVLAFFKVTCPVCRLAAPKVQALADGGARLMAVGQDPVSALAAFARDCGQRVPTVADLAPYPVSDAYGLVTVPTLFLVGADGLIADVVPGWDREGFNRVAAAVGAPPVSTPDDGLPSFRPG